MFNGGNLILRLLRRPPDIALDVFVNEICFYRLERLAIEDFLMDEVLVGILSPSENLSLKFSTSLSNHIKGLLLEDQEAIVEKKVSFKQGSPNRQSRNFPDSS